MPSSRPPSPLRLEAPLLKHDALLGEEVKVIKVNIINPPNTNDNNDNTSIITGNSSAKTNIKYASVFSATVNLCATAAGAGMLALPACIDWLGLPTATFFLLLTALFSDLSMLSIVRASQKLETQTHSSSPSTNQLITTLEQLAGGVFGSAWVAAVRAGIVGVTFGGATMFSIIFTSGMLDLIDEYGALNG